LNASLVIEQGNTPILQAVVRDSVTQIPVPNAVVQVTLTDSTGTQVTGVTWPQTLALVTGSQGVYRVQLPTGTNLIAGQSYSAAFQVVANGQTSNFSYPLVVAPLGAQVPNGEYATPPLQRRLAEAEEAYHRLTLGIGVASVKDQNGEEVTYSITNRAALAQYITTLKMQLGMKVNVRPGTVEFGERHRFWRHRGERSWR